MNRYKRLLPAVIASLFAVPAFAVTDDQVAEMQAELSKLRVKVEALEDAREDYGFKGLKISGMMDPTYIYNKARNSAGFNFLENWDERSDYGSDWYAYDNSAFGMLLVQLDKETDSGTKARISLVPSKSAGSAFVKSSIVHEAFVSVPLTDLQTRLIAGQIADWSGYEYLFGHQQKLITHNLLFDFTMPNFYQGAGLDLVRGKWWIRGAVVNMNQPGYQENRRLPAITYLVDYSKGEFQGFGFAGQHGKESGRRYDMVEVDAYFVRGDWTVFGQVSAGKAQGFASNGGDAEWKGASVFAAYKVTPRFELIGRADHIKNDKNGGGLFGMDLSSDGSDDRNGFGPSMVDDGAGGFTAADPNKGVNRSAVSLGTSFLFNTNTTLKAEYRRDFANGNVFLNAKDSTYSKSNDVVAASVVVTF